LRIEDFVEEFLAARQERSTAYEPREDTFLLLEALADISLEGSRVLEIGAGSGILATYCARRGAEVTASDIDADAIRVLRLVSDRLGTHLKLVVSDLFSNIDDRFDVVLFNPPYLPSDSIRDPAVDGGRGGIRIITRFLNQIPQHLVENGFALLLVCSLNEPEHLAVIQPRLSFEIIRQRSLFFERLYVLKVKPQQGCSVCPHP